MVTNIKIKNFKSVVDLSLELGNFNVFIGENGCGKSNILEAIAFGAAANANKLDYEFLGSRGIRLTNPEFMYSAFENLKQKKTIHLDFEENEKAYFFELSNDLKNSQKWKIKNQLGFDEETYLLIKKSFFEQRKRYKELRVQSNNRLTSPRQRKKFEKEIQIAELEFLEEEKKTLLMIKKSNESFRKNEVNNFVIYSPEQSSLRKLEETNQIYPLGTKGEGLFQYLKSLSFETKNNNLIEQIKENLVLLDWYEGFEMPEDMMKNEVGLTIRDKYLNQSLKFFDQRSTNEGFLFLLFYSTLFMSKITPSFFAIDNIDTSFNPKLCMQITKNLAALAKKNKKQAIVTTQNPAILDGLNLADDNQRLFVIRRNYEGHTVAHRVEYKSERKMKLSDVWTNGFIGGLPDNF